MADRIIPNINDSPSLWFISKMTKLMLRMGQEDLLVEWIKSRDVSTALVAHKMLQFLLDHGLESLVRKWLDEAERRQKSDAIERHRQIQGKLLDSHLPAEARKKGHATDPKKGKKE